jgi:predicted dehydrogenase
MSLRILVLGAGKMGREHALAFRAAGADLVAVVSRGGERARALADELGIPHAGSDLTELVALSRPDAAVIAVSHSASEQAARRCLEMGLHILAEKPAALTSAAVRSLSELASSRRLQAFAAVNRRFYPGLLDGFLRLSALGPLHHLALQVPDCPEERRASGRQSPDACDHWFILNTIHAVDLIRMMGGEVGRLDGTCVPRRPDHDSIVAHLLMRNGVQVSFARPGGPNLHWSLRLTGEGGVLVAEPMETASLSLGRGGPSFNLGHAEPPGLKMGLLGQAKAFISAIESGTAPFPASDLQDHSRSLELCERLLTLPAS